MALSRKLLTRAGLQEFAGVLSLPAPPRGFPSLRAAPRPGPRSARPPPRPRRGKALAKPGGRSGSAPHVCPLLSPYHIREGKRSARERRGRAVRRRARSRAPRGWRGRAGPRPAAARERLLPSAPDSSGHGGRGEGGTPPARRGDGSEARPSCRRHMAAGRSAPAQVN